MNDKHEETYYEVLKVSRNATISEIVAAYHTSRNAFSKESVATYSLFSTEETQAILDRLDEAYHTLANVEKKREYDQFLEMRAKNLDVPSMAGLGISKRQELQGKEQSVGEYTPLGDDYQGISGAALREIREKRNLSVEEVTKITKIPIRYVKAIESNDVNQLPARVYLQGFVKNLAVLYKLDPQLVTKAYLAYTDRNQVVAP